VRKRRLITYLLPEELPQAEHGAMLAQAKQAKKHCEKQNQICNKRDDNGFFAKLGI
jgi:hypothetical protein